MKGFFIMAFGKLRLATVVALAALTGGATLAIGQTSEDLAGDEAMTIGLDAEDEIRAIDPTTGGDSLVFDPSLPQPYGVDEDTLPELPSAPTELTEAALQLETYTGYSPAKGFVEGIAQGVTGIVVAPIQGLEYGGWRGFYRGLAAGIMGLWMIPLANALRIVSRGTTALRNTLNPNPHTMALPPSSSLCRFRPPRFIDPQVPRLNTYSYKEAIGDELISRMRYGKYRSEGYIGHFSLDHGVR